MPPAALSKFVLLFSCATSVCSYEVQHHVTGTTRGPGVGSELITNILLTRSTTHNYYSLLFFDLRGMQAPIPEMQPPILGIGGSTRLMRRSQIEERVALLMGSNTLDVLPDRTLLMGSGLYRCTN